MMLCLQFVSCQALDVTAVRRKHFLLQRVTNFLWKNLTVLQGNRLILAAVKFCFLTKMLRSCDQRIAFDN